MNTTIRISASQNVSDAALAIDVALTRVASDAWRTEYPRAYR